MRAEPRGSWRRGARALALLAGLALGPVWCHSQEATAPEPVPPPDDATDQQIVEHLLAPELGYWTRAGGLRSLDEIPARPDAARLLADARRFDLVTGAIATYRAPGNSLDACVIVLVMASRLDGLGVFAARRPDQPQTLALRSAAFWDNQALEAYAGRIYLHLSLSDGHQAAEALMRDLAAQLELRLPARQRPPRLMRVLPRRWLSPFSTVYGPTDLCGFAPDSAAVSGTYELGNDPVTLAVVELPDRDEAKALYGRLLRHILDLGQPHEIESLADEAFVCEGTAEGTCLGLVQDEFVAWARTGGPTKDAEAIMRLVALRVRITRPLPLADERD